MLAANVSRSYGFCRNPVTPSVRIADHTSGSRELLTSCDFVAAFAFSVYR